MTVPGAGKGLEGSAPISKEGIATVILATVIAVFAGLLLYPLVLNLLRLIGY